MKTKVVISAQAEVDIENAYLYIRQDAPEAAARWRRRLLSAIGTLDHFPLRYEIAPEARDAGMELRHMLFGCSLCGALIMQLLLWCSTCFLGKVAVRLDRRPLEMLSRSTPNSCLAGSCEA